MKSKIIILILCLILTGCKDKTHIITFNTNGGNEINSIQVRDGDAIKNIDSPKKEGYLFVSWLKDGYEYNLNNPVKEDLTLTASWIETPELLDTYTITYIIDNKQETEIVKENTTINKRKAPQKENYTFIGWYNENELYDFNNKITKDLILIAKYELNKVTITYDLDGGAGLSQEVIYINSYPNIPEIPKKEGYIFLKWTLNDQDFSFNSKVNKDITLKAIWEKIEYVTIIYDTDGGNDITPSTIEKYSKLDSLPIPKKEGYIFKEWQLDSKTFNIDKVVENNITIKAIYEESR